MSDIVNLGWNSLALLGGGGALISAFSTFASKYFADKALERQKGDINKELENLKSRLVLDLESHKHKIRREELLFDRDYSASNDWFQLKLSIFPKYMQDPNYDEMLESVGMSLGAISEKLYSFIERHSPILSIVVKEKIEHLAFSMGSESINAHTTDPSDEAKKLVDELFYYFPEAQKLFDERIRPEFEADI